MTAGVTTTIEFTNPAQHSFDSSFIELSSGSAQLKSQVSSSEILFSNYDTDDNVISKRGNKTLVFGGTDNTGQIANGVLEFPNQDNSIATYQNITEIVDDFALRFDSISNITTPAVPMEFARLSSNIDSSLIEWRYANQGGGVVRIYCQVFDSAGVEQADFILGTETLVDGTVSNLAVSNDDDGNLLMFYNGSLVNTISSPSFDFTDCDLEFGESGGASDFAVSDFDNVQLFNSHEITSSYTSPFPEPTTYVLSAQQIDTPISIQMDSWSSFSNIISEINGSEVKHQVLRNSTKYWYNTGSSAWEEVDLGDDLFTQSNTISEINDNLSSFPLTVGIGISIEILSFLKASTDGYTTPLLDQISLQYSASFKGAAVGICAVSGKIVDASGNPVGGATIEADSQSDFFIEDCLVSEKSSTTSNSEGIWSLSLIETTSVSVGMNFTFTYTQDGAPKTFKVRDKLIPDQVAVDFVDLVDAPEV